MKNTNVITKSNELISILDTQFKGKVNLARVRLIVLFICSLCKVQTVTFSKLANAFDSKATPNSSLRRIQRFIADFRINSDFVAKLIFNLLPKQKVLILSIDRTNWKFDQANINIFMLGVVYKSVAFPLLFKMLDKRGNSNVEERIDLVNHRIEKLVLFIMIAFIWCYKVGIQLYQLTLIKIKKHGRRAIIIFKYGLNYIANKLSNALNQNVINVFSFLSCT